LDDPTNQPVKSSQIKSNQVKSNQIFKRKIDIQPYQYSFMFDLTRDRNFIEMNYSLVILIG